ncbi:MAG: hypothetical protein ACYSUN_01960, partial [Planctomycetota bacterium]
AEAGRQGSLVEYFRATPVRLRISLDSRCTITSSVLEGKGKDDDGFEGYFKTRLIFSPQRVTSDLVSGEYVIEVIDGWQMSGPGSHTPIPRGRQTPRNSRWEAKRQTDGVWILTAWWNAGQASKTPPRWRLRPK